jgi:hypothetical protein
MLLTHVEKMIKKRRELLAAYVTIGKRSWRRVYPESFFMSNDYTNNRELEYIQLIYQIFISAIDSHRKTLIEDEINLMYMDIENKTALGNFSEVVLTAIQGRLDLKKQVIGQIKTQAEDIESRFPEIAQSPLNIKFRLESTVYLVRLLAYGLFSNNDILLERVAEVFDIAKLQEATKPKDKKGLDESLRFLYKGLIQKNENGRQGSRHAAKQTLQMLKEWYPDNDYVLTCIDKIGQYL